jgi:hypothetical protein
MSSAPPEFLVVSKDAWVDGPGLEVLEVCDTEAEARSEAEFWSREPSAKWIAVYRRVTE